MINLESNIHNSISEDFPFIFTTNSGEKIKVTLIQFDDNGKIDKVVDEFGQLYCEGEYKLQSPALLIDGFGYVCPGTKVYLRGYTYVLLYGWHTNISNQTIMSWYLDPVDYDGPPKTLYKSYLDEINILQFD